MTTRSAAAAFAATLAFGAPASASMTDSDWGRLPAGAVVEADGSFHPGKPFRAKELDVRDGRAPSGEVELITRLQAVDLEGRTVTLFDVRVVVTTLTTIRREDRTPLSLQDLSAGDWVELDALVLGDRTLGAERIKLLDSDPGKEQIDGTVTAVDPAARRLTIGGIEFRVSKSAEIRGGVLLAVPRSIDSDYKPRTAWRAFDGKLTGGGRFEYDLEPESEFDLDTSRLGNRTRGNWALDLHFDAQLSPRLEMFAKVGQRGRRIVFDDEGDEQNLSEWRTQLAYALWRPRPLLAVQVGRQDFDEPREWLYDENLDGARLRWARGRWRGETSVSTRWSTTASRLRDRVNLIVLVGREMAREWVTEAYAISRPRERDTRGDHPTWFGLRSHGRLRSGRYHWLELSTVQGSWLHEPKNAWALDVGLRWRLVRRIRLEVTGGYAYGSGGPNAGDDFIQTGFHDNNDKFGGVTSFKYYGELLDPELSNLEIGTLAAGFRPTRQSSVDVVYHTYRQPHPKARLFGANLESRPGGGDGDIGSEWDLIVGLEELRGLDLEYVYSEFVPGAAFDAGAARARFHKFQVVFTL